MAFPLPAGHASHRRSVSLPGRLEPTDPRESPGVPAFENATATREWGREGDVGQHGDLVRASPDGALARAGRIVHEHRGQVRQLVRAVDIEAGGEV